LTIREIAGEDRLALASAEHEVAELYYFKGDYDQAEPLYKHSLEIKKELLGQKHLSVAATLSNLAELYNSPFAHFKTQFGEFHQT
jgi:tetratricopeptide (TPR) repeat protein